jgi:hypothetical protein
MRFATWAIVLLTSLQLIISNASVAVGEDFRIETDVFVDGEKEPVNETLTIFTNGVVYDFLLTGVQEITLFDPARNRLVLMDTQRKIQTVLTMDSILEFMAQMKVHLGERKFLLPESTEVTDEDGWLKLANDRIVYRAQCIEPPHQAMALEYQEFADWYARLNAVRPHNMPPFLRIRLNSEMAKQGLLPKTIERTVHHKKIFQDERLIVRSQHLANWRLSNTDRKMIDRAGQYLSSFPIVSFREYFRLDDVAGAGANRR